MLNGSFAIDSRTGTGLSELREAIGQQAACLPQMSQLISPRWIAAREQILARAQVDPEIRYEEFVDICMRERSRAKKRLPSLSSCMPWARSSTTTRMKGFGILSFLIPNGLPRPSAMYWRIRQPGMRPVYWITSG